MTKLVGEWDEGYLLSLPSEDDTFERKGTSLLDLTLPGADENKVRSELAKQLSAFANTGGGRIIYGLSNNGQVDQGGVSRIIKGKQSTKEWLENVIPILTEYEIVGVNVFEVVPQQSASVISQGKAIFIVDVPDSDRAPHQSKADLLYYIRLGGKSQPASHRLLEDIRNRAKQPNIKFISTTLANVQLVRDNLPRIVGPMRHRLQVSVQNSGTVRATNSCLRVEISDPKSFIDRLNFENTLMKPRPTAQRNVTFWEITDPVYPDMQIDLWFEFVCQPNSCSLVPVVLRHTGMDIQMLSRFLLRFLRTTRYLRCNQ